MYNKRILLFFTLFLNIVFSIIAQNDSIYLGNVERIKKWENDRFGMYIHWGPSSVVGKELSWSRGKEIPIEEYDELYKRFNPSEFNAEELVLLAKQAGMRYIVFTTKHHDGFCMWNTKQTEYNIMNTPYGKDIVKELSDACKKYDIKFGVYYSTCDWYNPDFPLTGQGGTVKRDKSNIDNYTTYLKRQVAELLLNYGPLNTIWFDYPQVFDENRGKGVIELVRALQPDIMVNGRTGAKGDFDTPEQRVGRYETERPWETCMTIARQWGWSPNDEIKSIHQCLHTLIRAAGSGGNFILNIGPRPDGKIEEAHINRLKEIGRWLEKYGNTIYGTEAGPYLPTDWGACTRKGNSIYVHVLSWKGGKPLIVLPKPDIRIKSYNLLTGGKIKMIEGDKDYTFEISDTEDNPIDMIIELKMEGNVMNLPVMVSSPESFLIGKNVKSSSNPEPVWHDAQFVCDGDWAGLGWEPSENDIKPWIEIDMGESRLLSKAFIFENTKNAIAAFKIQIKRNGKWKTIYNGTNVGKSIEVDLPKVKARTIRLLITKMNGIPEISEFMVL